GVVTVPSLGTVNVTLTATGLNGFSDLIYLTVTEAGPGCLSISSLPSPIYPNTSNTVTVRSLCQPGNQTSFHFSGHSGELFHDASGDPSFITGANVDYYITVGVPSSAALPAAGSMSYPVSVTSTNAQTGSVTLSLAGVGGSALPTGVSYQ